MQATHRCGIALGMAPRHAGVNLRADLKLRNTQRLHTSARGFATRHDQLTHAHRDQSARHGGDSALGHGAPHYPLADHYNNDQWMYGDAHKKLVKSGDWRETIDLYTHRYITEDVELGLAFMASAARYAGVDAPLTHGILAVVGGFLGRDLRNGSRTLESLGLAGLDPTELQQRLHDGA